MVLLQRRRGVALVLARPDGAAPARKGCLCSFSPARLPRVTNVPDSPAQGQARHARHAERRDPPRRRPAIWWAIRSAVRADGRHDQLVAPVEWHARRGPHAPRAHGSAVRGAQPGRFRQAVIEMPLMQRQLLKLMLPTEAARSVLLYTAQLAAADAAMRQRAAGSAAHPLLKFRACRDARRVTGDAMEVRGGCGYIEEWSDARLLRDAHLGSIGKAPRNIVALDALRAIRKEQALDALLEGLPADEHLTRAARFADEADEAHAAKRLPRSTMRALQRSCRAKERACRVDAGSRARSAALAGASRSPSEHATAAPGSTRRMKIKDIKTYPLLSNSAGEPRRPRYRHRSEARCRRS